MVPHAHGWPQASRPPNILAAAPCSAPRPYNGTRGRTSRPHSKPSTSTGASRLSNNAPRRGLWAGSTPRRVVEKSCTGHKPNDQACRATTAGAGTAATPSTAGGIAPSPAPMRSPPASQQYLVDARLNLRVVGAQAALALLAVPVLAANDRLCQRLDVRTTSAGR